MSDRELPELLEKLSDACDGYNFITVMAATMAIAEMTIEEIHLVIMDEDIKLDEAQELANQLAAERLEYMAQLMRGIPTTDPHESLGAMQ